MVLNIIMNLVFIALNLFVAYKIIETDGKKWIAYMNIGVAIFLTVIVIKNLITWV